MSSTLSTMFSSSRYVQGYLNRPYMHNLHILEMMPTNFDTYIRESTILSLKIKELTYVLPQRNLNNAFAYDLVPSPSVITAALRAARRVNDFPTAVRIFEGTLATPRYIWNRVTVKNMLKLMICIRNQIQGRKPPTIRGLPSRIRASKTGTRHQLEGMDVSRKQIE